jgi:hypothetical protein
MSLASFHFGVAHALCRSTTIALALAVALLLLVLVISLVVLYIKHRRIYSAYSQVLLPPTQQRTLLPQMPHTFLLLAAERSQ